MSYIYIYISHLERILIRISAIYICTTVIVRSAVTGPDSSRVLSIRSTVIYSIYGRYNIQ